MPEERGRRRALVRQWAPRLLAVTLMVAVGCLRPAAKAADRGPWLTLTAPHVRVHFQPGYESTAIQTARVAEETVSSMAERLGHTPGEPIHLALMDVSDRANGFTEVAYYGRVVLFPVFPVRLSYATGLTPRMADWLRLVVTHEMVHAIHLDMSEGAVKGLRDLFGHVPGLSTPNVFQPVAFLEGLATYEETELVRGGRGEDALYEMYLRTAVDGGRLPELDQALGLYDLGHFQPGSHVYLYGYAWFDFMARHYGDTGIRGLQDVFAAMQVARPDEATRRLFNRGFDELWDQMRAELRDRYHAQAQRIRAAGETKPSSLPSGGWVAVSPRVDPGGEHAAYAAQGPFLEDLRLLDLRTGEDRQLATGLTVSPGGLDWMPGGQAVVYSAVDIEGGAAYADLYLADVAGGGVRRLTHGLRAYSPAVRADGRIAFASRDGMSTRLLALDASGGQAEVLWTPPSGWQILSLAWQPRRADASGRGARLAVSVWKPGGFADILLLEEQPRKAGAGEARMVVERQVTSDRAVDDQPAWSPDGKYVLFHSDRDGVYNLYAYDVDGRRAYRLTNVVTGVFDPAVTPDGATVVVSHFQPDGYRLAELPWSSLRWEPVALPSEPQEVVRTADAVMPEGWAIGPYRPLESLRPTFWEPTYGSDWAGPQIGAATGGMDALGRRALAALAAVGIVSGEPVLYAGYARDLGEGGGPVLTVEGSTAPVPDDASSWSRATEVTADLSWQGGRAARGWDVALSAGRLARRALYPVPEEGGGTRWSSRVGGQAGLTVKAGDHRHLSLQRWQLEADVTVADGTPWDRWTRGSAAVAGWTGRRLDVSGSSLRGQVTLGIAGGESLLEVGGEDGPFPVRAFGAGAFEATAAAAAGSVESSWRLAALRFGMGDAPTFFNDLSLAVFGEAATGWDAAPALVPTVWRIAADAGIELRLSVSLDYGRSDFDLVLGVVEAFLPGPVRRWYLRLDSRQDR